MYFSLQKTSVSSREMQIYKKGTAYASWGAFTMYIDQICRHIHGEIIFRIFKRSKPHEPQIITASLLWSFAHGIHFVI